jgi:LysR family transcriptional activator of nhaA
MSLSYRGLRYFWAVARLGTLRQAAAELHVSEPAVSAQIHKLQQWIGLDLFERKGRRLSLTPAGTTAFEYADQIFRGGEEMVRRLRQGAEGVMERLSVGITPGMPKPLVQLLLAPVVEDPAIGLVLVEGSALSLAGNLATRQLDVVLSDGAPPFDPAVRAHTHLLGSSGISFFASHEVSEALSSGDFPACLDHAPWLLPSHDVPLRRALDVWLLRNEVRPRIAAEFDDSALLTAFGTAGDGVFAAPTAIEDMIVHRYRVTVLGRTEDIRESYYRVGMEPMTAHEGVLKIEKVARQIFG